MDRESPVQSDWQKKHADTEQRKEDIRNRIQSAFQQNQELAKECYRPANPVPSLEDGKEKGVAVYARVSTSSEEQVSSIENQTLYYRKKIAEKPNWNLQKIYSDEGKSGTSTRRRDAFKRMIADARAKKIDLIICASVSRFARNVSDCLDQVRELKTENPSHPVGVYFETENIYSLNPDCEQALGVHALLADWESANKSRRMILSYDQRILTGQYMVKDLLGYRHTKDGNLLIDEEEAKTVRFIFLAYLLGYSREKIAVILTEKKRPTLLGRTDWNMRMVDGVMKNERRWGELEARKRIVTDYKMGKTTKNHGERCSAYVPEHHAAIVSPAIARAAQFVIQSRKEHTTGLTEMSLIEWGALKGFVSVDPSWAGVDRDVYDALCKSAYSQEELEKLLGGGDSEAMQFEEKSKIEFMDSNGFRIPCGVGYLTKFMPCLTVSKNHLYFNAAAHRRFDECESIGIYYHPLLRLLFVRKAVAEETSPVFWKNEDGKKTKRLWAGNFCRVLYEDMNWEQKDMFRLRGITKERNGEKIMFFFLDEPQVFPGRKNGEPSDGEAKVEREIAHVPYRDSAKEKMQELLAASVTAEDIREVGSYRENPLIGPVPLRSEMKRELEELLQSM